MNATKSMAGMRARIPLGAWPELGVADVRTAARTIKQNLALVSGPTSESTGSVGAELDRYEARRLSQLRKGVVMGRAMRMALDGRRHRDLSSITRKEIGQIVDEMADRAPVGANRTLAYLKAFFSWAHGRGYIDDNPVRGLAMPMRVVARERTPALSEIVDIWEAADKLGYPFGPVVQLLILTAARCEEVGAIGVGELTLPIGAPAVADRCLNHVGSATSSTISRVYARSEMYQQRTEALRRWAILIEGCLNQRPSKTSE